MVIVQIIYLIAVIWLSLCGLYSLWLTLSYWRIRRRVPLAPSLTRFPRVTVQLPLFNERYVVERPEDHPASGAALQQVVEQGELRPTLHLGVYGVHVQPGLKKLHVMIVDPVPRNVAEHFVYASSAMAFGLLAGALAIVTRSLWPAVGVHFGVHLAYYVASLFDIGTGPWLWASEALLFGLMAAIVVLVFRRSFSTPIDLGSAGQPGRAAPPASR